MTRLRPRESARGDDAELWQQLGAIGGRLAPSLLAGAPTRIRNRWLELSSSALTPGERIELLVAFCVELGARESRVRELVGYASERASEPGAAEARQRSAERRRRLTARP